MNSVSTTPETQTTSTTSNQQASSSSTSQARTVETPQNTASQTAPASQATNIFSMNFIDHLTQPLQPPPVQQQQQQQHPFFHVRDRLFHALFYRIAVAYARAVPASFRVALEIFAIFKVK